MYADPEFYFYRFFISRAEKSSVAISKSIIEKLMKEYGIETSEDTKSTDLVIVYKGKRIGIRFEDFFFDDDIYKILMEESLEGIEVIIFDGSCDLTPSTNAAVEYFTIEEFFDKYFSRQEFELFERQKEKYLQDFRNVIGYDTIPYLSPMNLFILKSMVEKELVDFKITENTYKLIDVNDEKVSSKKYLNDFHISEKNYELIREQFIENGMYKCMLSEMDFAKSFITSEWLYRVFYKKNQFDYTVIISGYLKSIEQLLYRIA